MGQNQHEVTRRDGMCFAPSNIRNLSKWNWDGDVIIQQPIVPSGRPIVGAPSQKPYPIDVREFLVSSHNAVMGRVLHLDIPRYLRKQGGRAARFRERIPGSFDYRAAVITNFVADTIKYQPGKGRDPWQFPDETLALQAGDCEDRAFLLASLLTASGVSPYNVRVAFGQMVVSGRPHDHMWVMYKGERGYWTLIEPLRLGQALADHEIGASRDLSVPPPEVEYLPQFLFNDSHMWAVRGAATFESRDKLLRRAWTRLNPKFAGEVHQSIVETALGAVPELPSWVLKELKRNFTRSFLGIPVIDSIDLDIINYSPLDHFDNGYIPEAWAEVSTNLRAFREDSRRNLQMFARAAHAIADFYAHSSYVHFARLLNPEDNAGHAELFQDGAGTIDIPISYEPPSTFDLSGGEFTVNEFYWKQTHLAAAQQWRNHLISGRYAQTHDTQPGLTNHLTEGLTSIPPRFRNDPTFPVRGSLPHHDEIAVDDWSPGAQHSLYNRGRQGPADRTAYENQFRWRMNTAILHVRKAFTENFTASGER
jgi:hypothetical protein